jgi:hypothetical protein
LSLSDEQVHETLRKCSEQLIKHAEMNQTGFALLSQPQLQWLYGQRSPYRNTEVSQETQKQKSRIEENTKINSQ